jgi:hypothetical protein
MQTKWMERNKGTGEYQHTKSITTSYGMRENSWNYANSNSATEIDVVA